MSDGLRNSRSKSDNSLAMIVRLGLMILTGVFLIIFIAKFLRRFLHRPRPTAPAPEAEIAPPAVVPGEAMEAGEAPPAVAAVAAPAIPDIYLTVPPELLFESDEPFLTADGKTIRYNFNWQNPVLLKKIYPFRLEKLRDFLLYFTEIDLVQQYHALGKSDPALLARLEQAREAMKSQRVIVQQRLNAAIEAKSNAEPKTFGKIRVTTPEATRFKQTYYVDQQIRRAQEKLDDLIEQQEVVLKKKAWPSNSVERQNFFQAQADLIEVDIVEARQVVADLQAFRDLFRQEAELPGENVTDKDILRWEMNQKKARWDALSADTLAAQAQLLKEIIEWVNRETDRFPEWVLYMVFHFSGMRYMSSHSSFAEPRALLENLKREDVDDDVKNLVGDPLLQACRAAAQRLASRTAPPDPQGKQLRERQLALLNQSDKRTLLEVCTTETLDGIEALPDDNACLEELVRYRQESLAEAQRDPTKQAMPNWVWAEICKFTPLRLQVADPDWEAASPERWKWQNNRWREILATWEQKDITSWRQKHRESLDLVVTRAVCNEIAEHIQHLRGLTPAAGLTSKPVWYMRQPADDPRAYFVQGPAESDFRSGASILWLEWVDTQPNAWQVAHPLKGFKLAPTDAQPQQDGQKKGEVSKKALEKEEAESDGWDYQSVGTTYTRTQQLPTPQDLKKQGKSEKEIKAIMAERKVTGDTNLQYLRWRHEAVVVGVFDMIDGRFVMTFETGPIGLRLRRLSDLAGNPLIFVGFVPARDLIQDPDPKKNMDLKLINMLRWDRILPGVPLPQRVRPKKVVEAPPTPKAEDEKPVVQVVEPGKPTLVIRSDVRLFRFTLRDNMGRPKMEPVVPPVRPPLGTHLAVSKTQKLSLHDSGNGVINAPNGLFLQVVECAAMPSAVGNYIRQEETADASVSKWVTLHPAVPKSLCNVFKGVDLKGKPIIQPLEDINRRIHLLPGMKFRVSLTHRESDKDAGDGVILGTGRDEFYLVVESPSLLAAEGLYVPKADVVDTTFP